MMCTPAFTSWSATLWAAPAGTAMTAAMMLCSATCAVRSAGRADRDAAQLGADLRGVVVEDRDDVEAVVGEDRRAGDRLAEPARADERDVVLARGAQDAADLGDQRVDVVADAALAELAERREVAPDLRRVDVRVLGDVLRRDGAATHLLGLRQHLQVARETRCNADRETFAHWGTPAIRRGRSGRCDPSADRARISSRLSRNAASGAEMWCHEPASRRRACATPTARSSGPAATACVNAISPSTTTTGRSMR